MVRISKLLICCLFLGVGLSSNAQDQEKVQSFAIELTGSLSHFEQQIKTKISGVKGDLLAANTEINIQTVATYKVW